MTADKMRLMRFIGIPKAMAVRIVERAGLTDL
jgi:hypothetical protein